MDAKLKLVGRHNSWPSLYRNYRGGLVSASSGDYPSELMKGAVKVLYGDYFRVYRCLDGRYILDRHDGGTDHENHKYYLAETWEDAIWGARQVCRAQDKGYKLYPKYGSPHHERWLDEKIIKLAELGVGAELLLQKKIGFSELKRIAE